MGTTKQLALFTPVQLGGIRLKHRVVMSPLTRSRSTQPDSIPNDLMREYYGQRASDGGLVITEATNISLTSRGWAGAPGIYTKEQIQGWKRILAAVHAKGGVMISQLWHTGRSSHITMTGGQPPVSASVNPCYWQDPNHLLSTPSGWVTPSPHRALTVAEIAGIVEDYRTAAQNAKRAGFDGIELHAANGYLVDQFLQDNSNKRTDEYGGSIENRSRFLLEIVRALTSVWPADRVAVRIGPGGTFNDMSDSDPGALFGYVAEQLNRFGLAYLHVIQSRVKGDVVVHEGLPPIASESMGKIFNGAIVAAGGFEPDTAEETVKNGGAAAIAFGRHFISNPDLPRRIREGLPLAKYDRSTFYTLEAHGYTDYANYSAEPETPSSIGFEVSSSSEPRLCPTK